MSNDKTQSRWDIFAGYSFFEQPKSASCNRDPRMVAAESIPKQPQAQYSTKEQLVILKVAANRLGLYDASDFLDRFLGH